MRLANRVARLERAKGIAALPQLESIKIWCVNPGSGPTDCLFTTFGEDGKRTFHGGYCGGPDNIPMPQEEIERRRLGGT
jgi:hypothetical protein